MARREHQTRGRSIGRGRSRHVAVELELHERSSLIPGHVVGRESQKTVLPVASDGDEVRARQRVVLDREPFDGAAAGGTGGVLERWGHGHLAEFPAFAQK